MKTAMTILYVLIAIVVVVGLIFAFDRDGFWERIAGPADLGRYDFDHAPRSRTPNDALACTPGLCGSEPDIVLGESEDPPAAIVAAVIRRVTEGPRPALRVDDRTDPAYARFVVRSPLMRFPDTVEVEALELSNGRTGIRAYARAQLGKSDFGANRAYLKAILPAG